MQLRRLAASPLALVPTLTLALFLLPIAAGLIGTWLPAFGILPSLGGTGPTLEPWARLLADPALPGAVTATLVSGFGSTLLAFALTVGFAAAAQKTWAYRQATRLLAPLLAVPHAAIAIGIAFLLAPSGFLLRLFSPWATGFELPPDVATTQDRYGIALALALAVKETPFLLLMLLGALGQVQSPQRLATARALGYGPVTAWLKTVLPAVYPQLRLPVYAVLAFSLSVIDMALILGPTAPPTLAVLVFRWFNDPDLALRFVGAAGATLQLLVVVTGIALWRLAEICVARLGRRWIAGGARGGTGGVARGGWSAGIFILLGLGLASLLLMALWSFAGRWRWPEAWPDSLTAATWARQLEPAAETGWTTLLLGLAVAGLALALVLGCLEQEQRSGRRPTRALWLLYLPLLVPQVAFLFGAQVLAILTGLDGSFAALVWSHLLFVLPYVFLALAEPWRRLDSRYLRSARCLGATPLTVFWRVKLPMLLRPVLFAAAVGFAVSVAQYLPTLFAGAGRYSTLTTEAVALSAGAARRVVGVYAFLQALLPLAAFAAAVGIPAWCYRNRRALQ
ncbi:ABC transporter permease [Algihabitans albus]|uniref:ABC transporter permease n=1 Tax=Algihabitans albus TaxID=2164067 RepID=UPI001F36CEA1|nr:ABC transporter permease subunit [Algihabitans albus]